MKLAEPVGLTVNRCGGGGETCPEELESPFARHSLENISGNLRGIRMMFSGDDGLGTPGVGFDDFLGTLGAPELAAQMAANIEAAIDSADALGLSLTDALASQPGKVIALHDRVKAITDDMKSPYLTILGLDLPDAAAGDND